MVAQLCLAIGIGVAALAVAAGVAVFCLQTRCGCSEGLAPFKKVFIAHRGLFDNAAGAPENSLAAFQRAVDYGYGIELDVQLSEDGELVVFHDEDLHRMCGVDRLVRNCDFADLAEMRLGASSERIPLFSDVLKCVAGRVPLIVEIKPEGDCIGAAVKAAALLDAYTGEYCVESFEPRVVRWFRQNRRDVIRGQLSTDYFKDKEPGPFLRRFLLSNLLLNWRGKPDFIAYNHKYVGKLAYRICRAIYRPVNVAWTIRSQDELRQASQVFDVFIFDSFKPESKIKMKEKPE